VGIALGYGLDDPGSRVIPGGGWEVFSSSPSPERSGAHTAYLMDSRGSFPGGKEAAA